jgi:hypothetical protein
MEREWMLENAGISYSAKMPLEKPQTRRDVAAKNEALTTCEYSE